MNSKTTISEIGKIPELASIRNYLIFGGLQAKLMERIPLSTMEHAGWPVESVDKCVGELCRFATLDNFMNPIYSKELQRDDWRKKNCHLAYFPVEGNSVQNEEKPYIILCAGGAYKCISNILEAYPTAIQFAKLGFSAFVLNYRVGGEGIMPKPMEDLAQAIRYIKEHENKFHVNSSNYIVCGFSAGGNLTGQWGTKEHGYQVYNMPKPQALFHLYPAVNHELFEKNKDTEKFMITMYGKHYTEEMASSYDVDKQVDQDYPASYIACCKDDNMVPYENSVSLKRQLEKHGVAVELEIGERGGHGFGEGLGTDVEGWPLRAVEFWRRNKYQ